MKKFSLILLLLVLLIAPIVTSAQALCDDSSGGTDGIVPCGRTPNPPPPVPGVTPPPPVPNCRCELGHIFILAKNIFKFIVYDISTPLAGLIIVIGGILILISGGPGGANPITGIASPNMYSTGKKIVMGAILGWFLIWGAWLIIHTVLLALGLAT